MGSVFSKITCIRSNLNKWQKLILALSFFTSLLMIRKYAKQLQKTILLKRISSSSFQPTIVIIGCGFSGINAAIRLKTELNYNNFIILERDNDIGGTWYVNKYPGCACDVPGLNYSLSFEPESSWTPLYYPTQNQTLEYLRKLCFKYNLYNHIQFNSLVTSCKYNRYKKIWNISYITINKTKTLYANIIMSCVGILSNKKIPKFKNIDKYCGYSFHSSEWDHKYDFTNKNVAVIGSGPTAIQVIPELGRISLNKLYIFQRSISWLLPKISTNDENRMKWTKRFQKYPFLQKIMRAYYFQMAECIWYSAIKVNSKTGAKIENEISKLRNEEFKDNPSLAQKVIPQGHLFGKRLLLSNELFSTYKRNNCSVITDNIMEFTPGGIRTDISQYNDIDCIVYCTGFKSQQFLSSISDGVIGKNGKNLQNDIWNGNNCAAYLGIIVSDFPNLFMLYGPGTNLGHNSVLFMIECAVNYSIKCITKMIINEWNEIDIKENIMNEYVKQLDKENQKNNWADPNTKNWYSNNKGRGSTNWAFSCNYYWWLTKSVNWNEYNIKSVNEK